MSELSDILGNMGLPVEKRRYTIAEYLALEERASERHEFHDGEILAMSGGTYSHSVISINIGARLVASLRGTPCRPLESNMRVRVPTLSTFVYPDLSVVCGGAEFDSTDIKRTTIINPRVVIEVLSDSTEVYDRTGKFRLYQQISSFEEYILVSQNTPLVESYQRLNDGSWRYVPASGLQASAVIASLRIAIPLSEIYEGVEFPADDTIPPT